MSRQSSSPSERRSFLAYLNGGIASIAALAAGSAALAQDKATSAPRWEPARHAKDEWLDKPGTKHRLVFDTTTPDGLGEALAFAGNYVRVNQSDYGVGNNELAVVIIVR